MSSLKRIRTASAPSPAAAYEQAIVCGNLIFVSGQVGSDPTTGKVSAASLGGQVAQALRNIEAIVEAAGGKRSTIVRCGVFLADLADFAEMNRAYAEFFGDRVPARTTVQAGLGALRVEIDAIAFRDASTRRPASRIRGAAKSRR
jgi:2-iminobutanoate/2-iminopropanoate deaminase